MKKFTLAFLFVSVIVSVRIMAQPPIRVVCVGNSITEGVGATSAAKAWPAQLGNLLGSRYTVLNCGVSGTTMLKNGSYPYWSTSRFTEAKNNNPQILIIALGTNDAGTSNWGLKAQFKTDYLAMITEFRKLNRNPIIYLCFPAKVFSNATQTSNIQSELIPILREISKEENTYIIDFYTAMLFKGSLYPDGLHPNDAGAVVMANAAYKVINKKQVIVPYVSVNNQDSVETTSPSVPAGGTLTLKPQPALGTWAWKGPSGFTSTDRVVTLSDIQLKNGGAYTAIYIDTLGMRSVMNFMVSIEGCTAASITSNVQVNNGSWTTSTSVTTNPGGSLSFDPRPTTGIWCWTGPNGFFSNSRTFSLNTILPEQAGDYTATCYNSTGCKSTVTINVAVEGEVTCPTLVPYMNINATWSQITSAVISEGGGVTFGPQPSNGDWSWSGPNGFSSNNREATVSNFTAAKSGKYIGLFTNEVGCKDSLVFTLNAVNTVLDLPVDDSGMIVYPNPATDKVTFKNVPAHTAITVWDAAGRVLMRMNSSDVTEDVDIKVSGWKSGVYYISLLNNDTKTFKVIKK